MDFGHEQMLPGCYRSVTFVFCRLDCLMHSRYTLFGYMTKLYSSGSTRRLKVLLNVGYTMKEGEGSSKRLKVPSRAVPGLITVMRQWAT